jgi:uncharacterized protein YecA (UPF0149 family)
MPKPFPYRDVTPQTTSERFIMFLPSERKYEGIPVEPKWLALCKDSLIENYIELQSEMYHHGLKHRVGPNPVYRQEDVKDSIQLEAAIVKRYAPPPKPVNVVTVPAAEKKLGRNDPCPCGSGNKFKRCCGS